MRQQSERRIEKNKMEKHAGAVDILHSVLRHQVDDDILNTIPLQLMEIDSLIKVLQAACENQLYDESFYQKHISSVLYLLQKRFENLSAMVNSNVDKQFLNKHHKEIAAYQEELQRKSAASGIKGERSKVARR